MTDSRRIENGGHELTIVHHRRDTCAGKAVRAEMSILLKPSRLSAMTDIGQLDFQGLMTADALV